MSTLVSSTCVDVATFLRLLHSESSTFEIRIPNVQGSTYAGFFDDVEKATRAVLEFERKYSPPAIYVSLNPVVDSARSTGNTKFKATSEIKVAKNCMKDPDVLYRRWLFVDIDPVRQTKPKSNSTDYQMEASIALAEQIRNDMIAKGWPVPLIAGSGNGAYLLWRIDEANNDESADLYHNCLAAFSAKYTPKALDHKKAIKEHFNEADNAISDAMDIDMSVHNAARICKVIGTWARKGENTSMRPHRRSFFQPVDRIEIVPNHLLKELSLTCPARQKKERTQSRGFAIPSTPRCVEVVLDANDVVMKEVIAECKMYLRKINPDRACEREDWLDVGRALHYVHPSLLAEWIRFSKQSPKFELGECEEFWQSFDRGKEVTYGTLMYFAIYDDHRKKMRKFRDNWLLELDPDSQTDLEFLATKCRAKNEEIGEKYRLSEMEMKALLEPITE